MSPLFDSDVRAQHPPPPFIGSSPRQQVGQAVRYRAVARVLDLRDVPELIRHLFDGARFRSMLLSKSDISRLRMSP